MGMDRRRPRWAISAADLAANAVIWNALEGYPTAELDLQLRGSCRLMHSLRDIHTQRSSLIDLRECAINLFAIFDKLCSKAASLPIRIRLRCNVCGKWNEANFC